MLKLKAERRRNLGTLGKKRLFSRTPKRPCSRPLHCETLRMQMLVIGTTTRIRFQKTNIISQRNNSFIASQSSFENTHQRKEEDNSRNICSVNLSIPEVVPENKDQSFYEDHELLENPQKCLQKLKVEEAKTRKLTEIVEELKVQLKKTRNEIIILREEKSLKRRTKSKTKENKRQSFILNLKNPKIHTTFSKQGRCNSKKTIVKSSNKYYYLNEPNQAHSFKALSIPFLEVVIKG